jgi:hypothetical protein
MLTEMNDLESGRKRKWREGMIYLQVAQDLLEQDEQLAEDVLMRLAPPPIPNAEKSF